MEFGGYKGTGPRVRVRRRAELGRRLTRRLSLVAKMPAAILSKANPPEPRPVEITAIAPDKTHLTVSKFYFIFSCFLFCSKYPIAIFILLSFYLRNNVFETEQQSIYVIIITFYLRATHIVSFGMYYSDNLAKNSFDCRLPTVFRQIPIVSNCIANVSFFVISYKSISRQHEFRDRNRNSGIGFERLMQPTNTQTVYRVQGAVHSIQE